MSYISFSILLSASVPEQFNNEKFIKIKNAQLQIEEAIIGLSRNIFNRNGRIIFGGHPSISPLVAMVASEFPQEKNAEDFSRNEGGKKPILIFQSKFYHNVIPEETWNLFNMGYSEIIWTDVENIETQHEQKRSLHLLREKMLSENIDAMVCIGGMQGVMDEFKMFRDKYPHKPVYVISTSGGASRQIADKYGNNENVKIIDQQYEKDFVEEDKNFQFEIIPYSYITALIIQDIRSKL